jgi:hypothetical protein
MSIEQINKQNIDERDILKLIAAVDKNAKGLAQVTVSEYDTDAACVVKAGSVFECNGATFLVSETDETPTGYDDISVSTTFYLYYDESEDEFTYSETAPTWSDSLQGWYNGNDRALFSMYKDSTGLLYCSKGAFMGKNGIKKYSGGDYRYYLNVSEESTSAVLFDLMSTWLETGEYLPSSGFISNSKYRVHSIYRDTDTRIIVQFSEMGVTSPTVSTYSLTATGTGTFPLLEIGTQFYAQ